MEKFTEQEAQQLIAGKLTRYFGVSPAEASREQIYKAVVMSVRDIMLEKRQQFYLKTKERRAKRVYYLCMEFLMGRSLKNSVYNLGIEKAVKGALKKFKIELEDLYEEEPDAGLGNGGLGRLAACFMDSLATLNYRAVGHCILYKYGLFKQKIIDSEQREFPDDWIDKNEIWLMPKVEDKVLVRFGGHISQYMEGDKYKFVYHDCEEVESVPYHMLLSGYNSKIACVLKLWSARTKDKFDNNKRLIMLILCN